MSEEKEVEEESKTKGVSREMKRKDTWSKWLPDYTEVMYRDPKLEIEKFDVDEVLVKKQSHELDDITFETITIKVGSTLIIELYSKDNEEIDVNIVDTSEDPGSSINLMYDEEVEQNGRIPMAFDRKVIEE